MPRCCDAAASDLSPCYASVLVTDGQPLCEALDAMEDGPISPCVTGWCGRCRRVSAFTVGLGQFPSASAYFAHTLALQGRVEGTLQAVRRERCR